MGSCLLLSSLADRMVIKINTLVNRKGNLPALAILVMAIVVALIIITNMPDVKQTTMDLIKAATGH